jgi:exodeoxyribonuclease V beta subunit
VAATQAHVESLGRDARLADLTALEAESRGAIALRLATIPAPAGPKLPVDELPTTFRAPLAQDRRLDVHWRVSSFSGLAASGGRTSHQAEEGLDHDAAPAGDEAQEGAAATAPERILLHDLPKGARTGELLHAILERVDFLRTDRAELGERVHDAVAEYGFDARWEAPIAYALDEVLATPIPADGTTFTLGEVASRRRFNELQFLFGVRAGFAAESLARCFERHPCADRTVDYPERIRRLRFAALEGYLGGFIDLVLEHGGRWYVVDYKSNFLGATPASYAPARLRLAMSQHHYHLQYHLYTLAVQRYLTLRVPGFDPTRDFGGVAYLFLRGMARRHPPGCGVFFTRPTAAILDELATLVGTADGEAAR